ncbi:prepilin peptidase, partial [Marmoricola sp. RAF53]|uniref:prepilin peptidase n=1 Tax=Marmoricola sp. RAF53 TaxID=3233059 RepID=UPI003F9AFD5C
GRHPVSAPDAAAWAAAAVGLVAGGAGGLLVRPMIAWLPEPDPEPDPDPAPEPSPEPAEPAKVLYRDLAATPGLPLRAALIGAFCGALIGLATGWDPTLLLVLPLIPVGIGLGFIDARTRLLPTRLVLPATAAALLLGALVSWLTDDWSALLRGLVAMLVVRSLFWVLWFIRSAGMGFGDVRLSALLGFVLGYLGWPEVIVGIYAGFLEFVIPGIVLAVVHRDRARLKTRTPFGPALLAGAVTGIVLGPWIARSLGY